MSFAVAQSGGHTYDGKSCSLTLRMFADATGSMWKISVKEIQGDILCVSQFTLLASTQKGSKPDFHRAMVGLHSMSIFTTSLDTHSFIRGFSNHHRHNPLRLPNRHGSFMPLFYSGWVNCTVLTRSEVRSSLKFPRVLNLHY